MAVNLKKKHYETLALDFLTDTMWLVNSSIDVAKRVKYRPGVSEKGKGTRFSAKGLMSARLTSSSTQPRMMNDLIVP